MTQIKTLLITKGETINSLDYAEELMEVERWYKEPYINYDCIIYYDEEENVTVLLKEAYKHI